MEEGQAQGSWEGYVDWRGRAALRRRHGGMAAASFVLVVEVLENLAYLANASNLVLYLSKFMHFSPLKAANNVTNFMGTAFLLALLGGFLSDAFFTTYYIYLISALVEFLERAKLVVVTAMFSCLFPPRNLVHRPYRNRPASYQRTGVGLGPILTSGTELFEKITWQRKYQEAPIVCVSSTVIPVRPNQKTASTRMGETKKNPKKYTTNLVL